MKSTRLKAPDVLKMIAELPQPVSWRQLVDQAGAVTPREITQLRQLLRGLERNGELTKAPDGSYIIAAAVESEVGMVEGRGRKLTVAGYPIASGQNLPLRVGDKVAYTLVADEVRIQDVVAFNPDPIAGVLQWEGRYPYVEAIGGLRGRIGLPEDPDASHGDTVSVQITGRDRRGVVGRVIERMERDNVLDEAISTALIAHQIPHEWPQAVTDAADRLPNSVHPDDFPKRRKITDMPLVTIDGETAKDFDDAVYAEQHKGGWRLVVAIADVAHYVKPDSPLDDEAVIRGTSVYFPERVVPMLPEAISNGLCSLKPEVARLALVCDMQVNRRGEVVEHDFFEAVIFSHARLTYTQVQAFLDNGTELPVAADYRADVNQSVKSLAQLFQAFSKAREKRGALDFPTHEGAIQIKHGRVSKITPVTRLAAHQLIEEAMIAANVCAARYLEACGLGGLYRVHEPPEAGKLEELRQALAYAGVRLAPGEIAPAQLQDALSNLPDTANSWLFGQLALRTMQQAIYTPNNVGHYGLALERYMHFTSPIRRYPDLVVHRLIKHQVAKRHQHKKLPPIPNPDEIQWLGETCSNNERRAESAGWMVDSWLKCDYLLDHMDETFTGIIATATDFGLFVELDGTFAQGLLHISNLGGDYFVFNARSQSLVGERNGRRFSMGDQIKVKIKHIEPAQGQIDLVLAEAGEDNKKRSSGKQSKDRQSKDRQSSGKQSSGKQNKDKQSKDKRSKDKQGTSKGKDDGGNKPASSEAGGKKSANRKPRKKRARKKPDQG